MPVARVDPVRVRVTFSASRMAAVRGDADAPLPGGKQLDFIADRASAGIEHIEGDWDSDVRWHASTRLRLAKVFMWMKHAPRDHIATVAAKSHFEQRIRLCVCGPVDQCCRDAQRVSNSGMRGNLRPL